MNKELIAALAVAARTGCLEKQAGSVLGALGEIGMPALRGLGWLGKGALKGAWGGAKMLGRGARGMVTHVNELPIAGVPGGALPQAAGRVFSPARTMGTGMLLGGAATADQFINPNARDSWNPLRHSAHYTAGRSINPWTWFNPNSAADAHQRSLTSWNERNDDIKQQIQEAMSRGDTDHANQLQQIQQSGSFAGDSTVASNLLGHGVLSRTLNWLNPFEGSMSNFAGHMRNVNTADQSRLKSIEQQMKSRGNMSADDRKLYTDQQDAIKKRMGEAQPALGKSALPPSGNSSGGDYPLGYYWQMGQYPYGHGWNESMFNGRVEPNYQNVWANLMARTGRDGVVRPADV
jgi:hypothetical protein